VLEMKLDERLLQAAIQKLGTLSGQVSTAAARAINRTLPLARKRERQAIAARYNLKLSEINRHLVLRRASARKGKLSGEVAARGKRVPLIRFKGGTKRPFSEMRNRPRVGARAKVLTQGRLKIIPGAFVARMPSGYVGIYIRAAKGSGYTKAFMVRGKRNTQHRVVSRQMGRGRVGRLPIVELTALSVSRMARKVVPRVSPELMRRLNRTFAHEIRFLLRRNS